MSNVPTVEKLASIIISKKEEISSQLNAHQLEVEQKQQEKAQKARKLFLLHCEKQLLGYDGVSKVLLTIPTDVDEQTVAEIVSNNEISSVTEIRYKCLACYDVFPYIKKTRMCDTCSSETCKHCGKNKRVGSFLCDTCHDANDRQINGGWS